MKLIRVGEPGKEKPAVVKDVDGKTAFDVSGSVREFDSDFFGGGGLEKLRTILGKIPPSFDLKDRRIGAPIARPHKVIGIGLNYADHAKESGMEIPPEPVIFMKATNSVSGPYDPVLLPKGSEKSDWEVELGVVIGRAAHRLPSKEAAADVVLGYCISNDVSERHFQLERQGNWDKGKSFPTFNPLGPWIATADEVPDPQNLDMSLDVNGKRMQTGNTKTMVYGVLHLVWYLSQFLALEPCDVISTGTPPGVGLGMKPPRFLKDGDVMELAIQGLGCQRQVCKGA